MFTTELEETISSMQQAVCSVISSATIYTKVTEIC
jgi:hypothetical protein